MVTVVSQELAKSTCIESLMDLKHSEYIHISPKILKLTIINLGMNDATFDMFKSLNASINMFDKNFKAEIVNSLASDYVILTNGDVGEDIKEKLIQSVGHLFGTHKIMGIGLGKELLIEATSKSTPWNSYANYIQHDTHQLTCFDDSSDTVSKLMEAV